MSISVLTADIRSFMKGSSPGDLDVDTFTSVVSTNTFGAFFNNPLGLLEPGVLSLMYLDDVSFRTVVQAN